LPRFPDGIFEKCDTPQSNLFETRYFFQTKLQIANTTVFTRKSRFARNRSKLIIFGANRKVQNILRLVNPELQNFSGLFPKNWFFLGSWIKPQIIFMENRKVLKAPRLVNPDCRKSLEIKYTTFFIC